jgi:predicted alpha/beta-fold hydrolase
MPEFTAPWWLRNPHLQTVWGRLVRPRRALPLRRETVPTPDGDELVLDHLDGNDPHFVLLHGLEGSSNSVYIQGILAILASRGLGATALNFRSCARDPQHLFRMLPNRRPRFYHSGETGDLDFVLHHLPRRTRVAFGASLGGNVLLKWLGEHPDQTLLAAAATISVPYDLAAGARWLERGYGPLYVAGFLRTLKRKVRHLAAAHPEIPVDLERALRAKTFAEFDDAATAPLHGFRGAADYYEGSSSIRFLGAITTPVLCVNAADDPFLPPEALERARRAASPAVEFIVTEHGGHVGFIGRSGYWAEELVVDWLVSKASEPWPEAAVAR